MPAIENYSFGSVTINGVDYGSDVIIYPDRVDGEWWRKEGHRLTPEDLKDIFEEKPEILIIGTGTEDCLKIPPDTTAYLESQGITLLAEKTDEACKTYNELRDSGRVVAALHLTC